ncbi:MAG: GTPase Era [Thermodesulfobacteriota bacterium]|nr:GTPase Era [Thermodesulfobacteriota bacterium]
MRGRDKFKSGFISIIGKTNVGKSTLLNRILRQKITIISAKPQTTRNRILGIKNTSHAQMIFLDTPGIHRAKSKLNRYMVKEATKTYSQVDMILLMVEVNSSIGDTDRFVIKTLREVNVPIVLTINKIDLFNKGSILVTIDAFRKLYDFEEIIPISALKGSGVDPLLVEIERLLPFGPRYFPEEMITDMSERFIVAEIIREKVFRLTSYEIPYSVAVVIDDFKEKEDINTVVIRATIHVEQPSQKGILIGKRGSMLKEIGRMARIDVEDILGTKVYLELWVKVEKGWSKDTKALRRLGYR